jgi:hypothetical protein
MALSPSSAERRISAIRRKKIDTLAFAVEPFDGKLAVDESDNDRIMGGAQAAIYH